MEKDTMKATLTNRKSTFNINHRKERKFYKQMVAVVFDEKEKKFREVATVRFYYTDSRVYACFWGWGTSGSGYAGGGGYDRPSAAAAAAFYNAGYDFDEDISGRGNGAVSAALLAIARAEFPNCPAYVSEAYG